MKLKKCAVQSCRKEFAPKYSSLQKTCSPSCAALWAKAETEKKAKGEWQKEKKVRQEALMTTSDWRNLLQKVFNTYIRIRDKDKACVSCAKPFNTKYDAGHFYSVGSYPNLRFNEDNVHGQCVQCNRDLHGNHAEYSLRLPERIGQERFNALTEARKETLRISETEIKELLKHYRLKINEAKKTTQDH